MHPMIIYVTTWILLLITAEWMSPDIFVFVLGGSVLLVLIGLFPFTFEKLMIPLLRLLHRFGAFRDCLDARMNRMKSYLSGLRRENGMVQESVLHARVAAFLLISALTLIIFLSEIYLSAETARALLSHSVTADIPGLSDLNKYMDWMIGFSVSSGALLWGIYLSDARGNSNLTAIHDRPAAQRKWIQIKASFLLALVLSLLIGFAVYRSIGFSLEDGAGTEQTSKNVTSDEEAVARLMMDGNDEDNALPVDNSLSRFEQPLILAVQVALAVVIFYTLALSEWLIGCAMTFSVMVVITLVRGTLWSVWILVCGIHAFFELVGFGPMVSIFHFIARISISITAPLAAQLGLQYVDDSQAYLASLETSRPVSDGDSGSLPEQSETERTQEAVDFGNRQAHLDSENTSSNNSKKDNDEPDMIVSGDPDEEKSSHNWSPFKK